MSDEQYHTNPTTQPENSADAVSQDAAQVKLNARLAGIDSYRKKRAAHPDDAVAQLGQMTADLLEMQAIVGQHILNRFLENGRYSLNYNETIGVSVGLVRQAAQMFKLEKALCDRPAAARTDVDRGDSPSE